MYHNFVPILSCDDAHEQQDCLWRGAEVGVSAQVVSRLDAAKQDHTRKRVHQHEQEHAHDDEETFKKRNGYCKHQHF